MIVFSSITLSLFCFILFRVKSQQVGEGTQDHFIAGPQIEVKKYSYEYIYLCPVSLLPMFLDRGRTPESPQETRHAITWNDILFLFEAPYLTNCMQEQCTWGKRLSVLSLHYCQWVDLECDWHVFLLSVVMTTHHTVLGSQCGVLFTCLVNGPLTFLSFRSSFP